MCYWIHSSSILNFSEFAPLKKKRKNQAFLFFNVLSTVFSRELQKLELTNF